MHYTHHVELIVLGVVILLVAIDALLGRRSPPREADITTQKIIVDLTKRR